MPKDLPRFSPDGRFMQSTHYVLGKEIWIYHDISLASLKIYHVGCAGSGAQANEQLNGGMSLFDGV
jgi:hypothetical protein